MLQRSSDVQSLLRKSSALFGSCVTKALDVGSSSDRSPSAGAMKTKRPRIATGLKGAKNATDGWSSCKDNIDLDSV